MLLQQGRGHYHSPFSLSAVSPPHDIAMLQDAADDDMDSSSRSSSSGQGQGSGVGGVQAIETLRLESAGIDNRIAQIICKFTNVLTSPTAVCPCFPNVLHVPMLMHMCAGVSVYVQLTELNVCDNEMLTAEGFQCFRTLTKLKILNVSGCKFTNANVALLQYYPDLLELYMDCQTVSDEGLVYLRNVPRLEKLDIFEAHITDSGIDYLYVLPHLLSLEICGGRISNAGLAKICKIQTLQSLNLSQVCIAGMHTRRYYSAALHVLIPSASLRMCHVMCRTH